jgi:Protein of unknown function (DUF2924)
MGGGKEDRMGANISNEIAQLPGFSRQQLLDLWRLLYGREAPPGIRRELMVPFLAYRTQERAYGGLKPAIRSKLLRIARDLEKSPSRNQLVLRPKAKTGTRIFRRWRGESHEVLVTEAGYEYRGAQFKSLSGIARKITGTRWSGPSFFGLKQGSRAQDRSDD